MNTTRTLKWFTFDRVDLPLALMGRCPREKGVSVHMNNAEAKIAVGYEVDDVADFFNLSPTVIVLDDRNDADIFSWLKTFAPETSPLTQFARVLSNTDWKAYAEMGDAENFSISRPDRWSSLIVGEILSQSDSEVELKSIPTSISSACFTYSVARTALHYSSDRAFISCVERLQQLENDSKFFKRNITVFDLVPLWSLVQVNFKEDIDPIEAANLIVDGAIDYARHTNNQKYANHRIFLHDFPDLFGDSIEKRVVAFNSLVAVLSTLEDSSNGIPSNALLAAAAFLVGRGTSHAFLLKKVSKKWHSVFVWFGLIAAFSGPKTWDMEWSRVAKITERSIRGKFDILVPSNADLCWAEYSWMSKTFSGIDIFNDLPKQATKSIVIEILPGVTCQFRLAITNKADLIEKDHQEAVRIYGKELHLFVEELFELAMHGRALLKEIPKAEFNKTDQKSLFPKDTTASPRRVRVRKSKS